jgi:hypothetical protein
MYTSFSDSSVVFHKLLLTDSYVKEYEDESTADSLQSNLCLQMQPIIKPQSTYCEDILAHLLKQEEKFKIKSSEAILKVHKISAGTRARVIDWMIEVIHKTECNRHTFFLAVTLIDSFLVNSAKSYNNCDIHIIGVTAILIASKIINTESLDIDFMYEQVVHKKVPKKIIQDFETQILKALKFHITVPTELEFLEAYWEKLRKGQLNVMSQAQYLSTLNLYNIDMTAIKPSVRAAGSLAVAMKELGEVTEEELLMVTGIEIGELREVMKKIEEHRADFKKLYPKLKNALSYYK